MVEFTAAKYIFDSCKLEYSGGKHEDPPEQPKPTRPNTD